MKLGLQLGYWGAQPPEGVGELVAAAEEAGFDAIFTAEAWGSDAFTPLAWWGRETSRVRLGTSIVQMSGRSPTSIAMHALTLDHLTGGRVVLGMGVSGPQVVEGWYGAAVLQAAGPHPRGDRHHPPGARPRGSGDQRRAALPAAVRRGGVGRSRQAAQADRAPAARGHPDLARRRGAEERRADRRDRRRLDPDLLHAQDRRDVPAVAGRGLRASGRPSYARGLRDRSHLPPPDHHQRGRSGRRSWTR